MNTPISEGDLATRLGQVMVRVMSVSGARAMSRFVALDLSMVQVRILLAVSRHPEPMTIGDIGRDVEATLVTASRAVDILVGGGFADRREDPQDRRVKRVSLTSQGTTLLAEQSDLHHDSLRDLVERLQPDEREALEAALQPLLRVSEPATAPDGTNTPGGPRADDVA